MGLVQDLKGILRNMRETYNIEACAVVSRSGIPIVWDMPDKVPVETIATLSATILGASDVVCTGLEKNPPTRIIVETPENSLIVLGLGSKALLMALSATKDIKTLTVGVEETAKNIREVLKHEKS
jgi:predicted regulator of Ras-like GTPase activity (Roadblock/LC7/MglB family)